MTEHGHGHGQQPPAGAAGTDREIDARRILEAAAWLGGVTIGSFVVAWLVYLGLAGMAKGEDPRPSPLAQARDLRLPPGPQLQVKPEKELAAYRAAEAARLNGWGWVDQGAGIAHIPVERAIDLYAAEAVTAPAPVATPVPAAAN
jgi:hypothetical protein